MLKETEQSVGKIASEQIFSDRELCRGCDHPTINPLTGGLINANYITCIEADSCSPYIITVFPNPTERIQQERFVRELLPDRSVVPFAKILKTGVYQDGQKGEQGFMVRQYVPGITLHEALSHKPEDQNVQMVLYQLGKALSSFHETRLPAFGKITGNRIIGSEANDSWQEHVLGQIRLRMERIRAYSRSVLVGDYSAGKIQDLLPTLGEIVRSDGQFLEKIIEPRLVHHDFHFLNIIVDDNNGLKLATILDTENITAGDPSIDLVSIESQLNLAVGEYQDLFLRNIRFFREGYLQNSHRPPFYDELRRLYHVAWSLSYFSAVLNMDTNIHPVTAQVNRYMDRHYYVLSGLSAGVSLEELGIQSIMD